MLAAAGASHFNGSATAAASAQGINDIAATEEEERDIMERDIMSSKCFFSWNMCLQCSVYNISCYKFC